MFVLINKTKQIEIKKSQYGIKSQMALKLWRVYMGNDLRASKSTHRNWTCILR